MNKPNTEFAEEEKNKYNSGLKISNRVPKIPPNAPQNFDSIAQEFQQEYESLMQEALELGQKFMALMEDQTLPENKTEVKKSIVKETLTSLDSFITKLNNDNRLPEGEGSGVGFKLLFSSFIKMRDKINTINFNIAKLNKEIQEIKKEKL